MLHTHLANPFLALAKIVSVILATLISTCLALRTEYGEVFFLSFFRCCASIHSLESNFLASQAEDHVDRAS